MVKSVARQTRLKLDERIGEVVDDQLGQVPQQIEAEGQLLQLKQKKATNVKDKLVMKPDGRTKDYANTSFVLSSFRGGSGPSFEDQQMFKMTVVNHIFANHKKLCVSSGR